MSIFACTSELWKQTTKTVKIDNRISGESIFFGDWRKIDPEKILWIEFIIILVDYEVKTKWKTWDDFMEFCLLWIDKSRTIQKTYMSVGLLLQEKKNARDKEVFFRLWWIRVFAKTQGQEKNTFFNYVCIKYWWHQSYLETSRSYTHPSHSQTSLLTSSVSLGVPVPYTTQCWEELRSLCFRFHHIDIHVYVFPSVLVLSIIIITKSLYLQLVIGIRKPPTVHRSSFSRTLGYHYCIMKKRSLFCHTTSRAQTRCTRFTWFSSFSETLVTSEHW